MNNQKGFSVLILIVVVALLGAGAYLYMNKTEKVMTETSEVMEEGKAGSMDGGFEVMGVPEDTPSVVDKDSLDELDALMNEVDSTVSGEDLSDL